ncbi:sortase A [Frigoribacterium sp. PhB160]|uniref:class E sortase n=1 Tax=Frigoribacterium sp. PhB160 TaxID=2485192 RepID=UPI000F47CEF0|nr:class E sortase [Frigoribacterium sp. PhB160]ROS58130.1 sortase A [Frigoribacterium sp. PhB160]
MTDDQRRPRGRRTAAVRRPRRRVSVVGVLGELLITAGVLVLLFIGWQQWFNDLVVAGEHRDQASQLSDQFRQQAAEQPSAPADGEPPVTPAPAEAETFANFYVPRFGADYAVPIAGGTSTVRTLNAIGIGHYDDTQMPGEVGNFGVAAHRTTYGAPFAQIADLQEGDRMYVQTKDGWYTYVFRNLQYVQPTQVSVLQPVPDAPDVSAASGERLITLTSCNPKYTAQERIVAYGVYDSWQPLDQVPAELAAAGVGS